MIHISAVGVKNIRSLMNIDPISIKPITILVGRNSSGKSTFARLLPLLKQSAENRKLSPILWYGRLVDFGSFKDVKSKNSQDDYIEISLEFTTDSTLHLGRHFYYQNQKTMPCRDGKIKTVFKLCPDGEDGNTVLKEFTINIFDVEINFSLQANQVASLKLDGELVALNSGKIAWSQGRLMPIIRQLVGVSGVKGQSSAQYRVNSEGIADGYHLAIGFVEKLIHGRTSMDTKDSIIKKLQIAPYSEFLQLCGSLPNSPGSWKVAIKDGRKNYENINSLRKYIMLYRLDMILDVLDEVAARHLSKVSYLEPLRATAQRFYRREEMFADELDAKGLNTPFFIQSLSSKDKNHLQDWMRDSLGFSLDVKNSGGHLSMNIRIDSGDSGDRNLADVGLGYSQLSPVAIQMWAAKYMKLNNKRNFSAYYAFDVSSKMATVIVEQPELHLHPAYQSRIADLFVAAIKKDENVNQGYNELQIIAETHSPNLISRLGELIYEKKLNSNDVQILVFEPSPDNQEVTKIRKSEFDEKGKLKNWPIGFFDA